MDGWAPDKNVSVRCHHSNLAKQARAGRHPRVRWPLVPRPRGTACSARLPAGLGRPAPYGSAAPAGRCDVTTRRLGICNEEASSSPVPRACMEDLRWHARGIGIQSLRHTHAGSCFLCREGRARSSDVQRRRHPQISDALESPFKRKGTWFDQEWNNTEPLFQLMNMFPAEPQALQYTEKLGSLQDYTQHSNLPSHQFLASSLNNVPHTCLQVHLLFACSSTGTNPSITTISRKTRGRKS
jgi:hypothetical protein